jgi:hypothetical protein
MNLFPIPQTNDNASVVKQSLYTELSKRHPCKPEY